ncbi:TRAP transporter small permease subunit [Sneathiella litorea]|uniref:TRAP transporter small permease protein n=1 Tax=Sneathiella litorea TaxID=2606216 RepID=A0A6L8WC04_9PROT|nr:TRAP transporter small permease subunit [Sneathiella litorea]MZR31667.1 TRAP transporter small permease subunit [Sneathiella litorea]
MAALTTFARTITNTNVWIGRLASYAVLILFVLLMSDVVMRYITQSPISWSSLASKMIFGVYAIIGGGYLLARRDHVNVDLFYGHFSARKKALTDIATSFLFFLFLGVLLSESYSMAYDSISRLEVSYETTWRPAIWPSKSMIFVSALLLLLQGIVKLIADIMILCGIEVDENAYGPVVDDETHEKESV